MIRRLQKLNHNNSFFLFGARGTGKSTLVRELIPAKDTLWIDLLKHEDEERFGRHPDLLSAEIDAGSYKRVVIDEVQKAPKILDIVHREIERHKEIQFALTGSSARKLKRGSANLLAGRAFTYSLYPFTSGELGDSFDLQKTLELGTLPRLQELESGDDQKEYLRSYVRTYLKEEIQVEQLVRRLNPFRDFLEIAAQTNGQIVNYSKLARQVGSDDKTIRSYFQILEDTLVGFHLPAFNRSIRKQQRESPKFFLFDPGVARALSKTLRVELVPQTYAFGRAFEHWIQLESQRLNDYLRLDYRLSYLRSKDGAEIDLVVERPGKPDLLVEIKSTIMILPEAVQTLERFRKDWGQKCETQVWSRDKVTKKMGNTLALHWTEGLQRFAETTSNSS